MQSLRFRHRYSRYIDISLEICYIVDYIYFSFFFFFFKPREQRLFHNVCTNFFLSPSRIIRERNNNSSNLIAMNRWTGHAIRLECVLNCVSKVARDCALLLSLPFSRAISHRSSYVSVSYFKCTALSIHSARTIRERKREKYQTISHRLSRRVVLNGSR